MSPYLVRRLRRERSSWLPGNVLAVRHRSTEQAPHEVGSRKDDRHPRRHGRCSGPTLANQGAHEGESFSRSPFFPVSCEFFLGRFVWECVGVDPARITQPRERIAFRRRLKNPLSITRQANAALAVVRPSLSAFTILPVNLGRGRALVVPFAGHIRCVYSIFIKGQCHIPDLPLASHCRTAMRWAWVDGM
jgi:hypothetical protein